jgi:hypothetical protein
LDDCEYHHIKIQWLGSSHIVDVIVSESDDFLIGTELLDGARLTIDFMDNTVTITDEQRRSKASHFKQTCETEERWMKIHRSIFRRNSR